MHLSLVICTRNNARQLRVTLETMTRLNVDPGLRWELVLVNNASEDETDAVAAAFAGCLPIRYVDEPQPGLSRGRNAGLSVASGELIVFADDDVFAHPDWLNAYWRAYRMQASGCYFGGSVRSRYEGHAPPAPLRRIAPPSVVGLNLGAVARELELGEDFIGANWAVPAAALAQVGGFDPALGLNGKARRVSVGEESDLMHRLRRAGWRPWHVPEAWLEHWVPRSKCTREHIFARRIAQFRGEALRRYGAGRYGWQGIARAFGRGAYLWMRAMIAPLVGRTGLLSRAQARGYFEAAMEMARRCVGRDAPSP